MLGTLVFVLLVIVQLPSYTLQFVVDWTSEGQYTNKKQPAAYKKQWQQLGFFEIVQSLQVVWSLSAFTFIAVKVISDYDSDVEREDVRYCFHIPNKIAIIKTNAIPEFMGTELFELPFPPDPTPFPLFSSSCVYSSSRTSSSVGCIHSLCFITKKLLLLD